MKMPLIKWTGSKRKMAPKIVSYFPKDIDVYYEPFLGGGSVFFRLLQDEHSVKKFYLSDQNMSLIQIFSLVQKKPNELISSYREKWEKRKKEPEFFYAERDEYNKTKDPHSFYFLTRTCYNGTIRYNSKGNFNTSFHFGRDGMHPDKIQEILNYYHLLMRNKDIIFKCQSYETVIPENIRDLVYLDPPYTNTKALYHGNICLTTLTEWIRILPCSWYLNINGVNVRDNEESIPLDYTDQVLLESGKSSFSRMKGNDVMVGEYFYYKSV